MGIIIGMTIGLLSSLFFYRLPPLFVIILGAFIGYLIEYTFRLNEQIKSLHLAIDEIKNLFRATSEKPDDKPTEKHTQPESTETNTNHSAPAKPVLPSENTATAEINTATHKPDYALAAVNTSDTIIDNKREQSDTDLNSPLSQSIKAIFIGDHTVLRIGIVVLFLGIAFLLKYAAENFVFPIELRLVGTAIAAMIILWLGWKLKPKRESYALALQGAGVGILYLDIFGAMKLTTLLPPAAAFVLLILVCIFSAALAVSQNAKTLATMGAIGGFLAPILASTHSGNYQLLFSYYLLLNSGILAIAWYKSWRTLNLIGFIFTFGIGLTWGAFNYQAEMFWNIELFLLAYFLQFIIIAILFAIRQPENNKGYIDGTLVFGTPLIVFSIQTYLLKIMPQAFEYGLSLTALGLAALYILISYLFIKTRSRNYILFSEATLALAVLFATLTIPLALNDGLWTSAAWALEGSALLWIGLKQNRFAARVFGIALQFFAGAAFLIHAFNIKLAFLSVFVVPATPDIGNLFSSTLPVLNSFYMGCMTVFIAGMIAAYLLYKNRTTVRLSEFPFSPLLLVWALVWWFVSGIAEIQQHTASQYAINYSLVFVMFSCLGFYFLARILSWPKLIIITTLAPVALLIALIITILQSVISGALHPFANHGNFTWPIAFILFYALYYFIEKNETQRKTENHHISSYLIMLAVIFWEIYHQSYQWLSAATNWNTSTWMLFIIGTTLTIFMAISIFLSKRLAWPFKRNQNAYLLKSQQFVFIVLAVWLIYSTLFSTAEPLPLSYIPLINPLELSQAFSLLTIMLWVYTLSNKKLLEISPNSKSNLLISFSIILFIWFNSLIVRTLGHWGKIPFDFTAMLHSPLAQTSFSIAWTFLSLFLMSYATKTKNRGIWFAGISILALTIIKLFLIDLANIGTLGRIISFIGVGIMLLIISYFSPMPPRPANPEVTNNKDAEAKP